MMTNDSLEIEYLPILKLTPYDQNARTHSRRQIKQIAKSIETFGFTNPVLISDDGEIIAGHGRVRAAELLGMHEVPTLKLSHLSEAERRAYVLADNKLALNAGWDQELLAIELQGLIDLDFDVELTGFELAEIDIALAFNDQSGGDDADKMPEQVDGPPVTRTGDIWLMGKHRLLCGDAQRRGDIERLVGGKSVDLIFTDPPYNVQVDGNVCGKGSVKHKEFAFASGEMTKDQFTSFLTTTLSNAASVCRDGAIAFVCMDWRHMREMLDAGETAFDELKNLCVWNKTNGGMGSFYRSKHELVFVFKKGTAANINSFGLGETGRYRTNVWDYAGISSMSATRGEELAMHPTVKPVAMIEDAIKDCSKRRDIVLDMFAGSGSTLIAAEQCGRTAYLLEYEPAYCDTIVRRWQKLTGQQARLEASGQTFEEIAAERFKESQPDEHRNTDFPPVTNTNRPRLSPVGQDSDATPAARTDPKLGADEVDVPVSSNVVSNLDKEAVASSSALAPNDQSSVLGKSHPNSAVTSSKVGEVRS
ncbi:site-specific DNA-methyltransferase [Ahrensia marina]|uniref:site-specific DNA-methyltransferase n=1 Tax=Ahrensia marina TaxID=1514904 RepID=UPI000A406DE6|nr:DNA methyltransferase [Ahrensia marina]